MSLNKLYAFPLLVLPPLTSVAKCDPSQTAPDHSKVCKAPNGYKQAGRKKTISLYRADFFTIPKNAKGWNDSNCGTIFRKNK